MKQLEPMGAYLHSPVYPLITAIRNMYVLDFNSGWFGLEGVNSNVLLPVTEQTEVQCTNLKK